MFLFNELLFFIQIFLTLIPCFYCIKKSWYEALYLLSGFYIFFANFLVMKEIELLGIYTTPVEPFALSLFVIGNYVHEKKGAKKAFKLLYMSWFIFFFLVLLYGTCVWHIPSLNDSADQLYQSLWSIFSRATFFSFFSCIISFSIERFMYAILRKLNFSMFISSLISLFISQLTDTTIFSFLLFDRPINRIVELIAFSIAIKIIYITMSFFYLKCKQNNLKS